MNNKLINESELAWAIKENGIKVKWMEKAIDRDGWENEIVREGYEYLGKRYILHYDRDGWLWAEEV